MSPHAAGLVARQYPALGVGTRAATADRDPERDVDRIDHVVFTAPDRVQAIALFGGVLGLDFRLAQSTRGVEQLFFRATEVVVEVLAGVEGADDAVALWGVAWRSVDLETTRARLVESGVDVSEIRPGRKPGTRVVTVRDDALGTATLLIEHVRHA
nr:VOC family protein [Rhodococcus sp. HNM0569]